MVNFSGISNKSVKGKLFRLPLRFIPPDMVLPILQGRLRGKKWIVGSSNHGCWLGSYEYEKRLFFEKTVAASSVVFDIGAHVGFYTLLAAVLVGEKGRVFAFEPVPHNLVYLREHLRMNRITNVIIIEAAVSDHSGMVRFNEGAGSSMGYIASQANMQVRAVSLDDLMASGEFPAPTQIKNDVEGSEVQVLLGAKSLLAGSHPTLFLATHGEDSHRQCCHILSELRYDLRPIGADCVEQTDELLATYTTCHELAESDHPS